MTKEKDDIERLFRTHYAAMYRHAMLILRDDDVARDIVHDVFEALLVSGRSDVSPPYLLTAVRNRCLKHIRSLSANDRLKEVYSVDEREIEDGEWPDDETIVLIQKTVASDLTEASRRVVELRFSEGKSYQEITDILGISKVAVYKHLRHAIDVFFLRMDKIDRFLDAIEYPERYTQSDIDAMLQDPDVKEMFDLLDKTKSSLQTLQIPEIETEWKRFEKNHPTTKVPYRFWPGGIMSRNIAATIAIAIVSFTAVAAIVSIGINQLNQRQEVSRPADVRTEYAEAIAKPDSVRPVEAVKDKTPEVIVFDNEPLKTIAGEIAGYYDCKVEFNNEASKSLRLYFRWDQENTLEEVVERLGNFEQIHIVIKDKTIKID